MKDDYRLFFVVVEIERICYTLIYIVLDSYLKLMFLFVSAQDGAESSSAGSLFTQLLHILGLTLADNPISLNWE